MDNSKILAVTSGSIIYFFSLKSVYRPAPICMVEPVRQKSPIQTITMEDPPADLRWYGSLTQWNGNRTCFIIL